MQHSRYMYNREQWVESTGSDGIRSGWAIANCPNLSHTTAQGHYTVLAPKTNYHNHWQFVVRVLLIHTHTHTYTHTHTHTQMHARMHTRTRTNHDCCQVCNVPFGCIEPEYAHTVTRLHPQFDERFGTLDHRIVVLLEVHLQPLPSPLHAESWLGLVLLTCPLEAVAHSGGGNGGRSCEGGLRRRGEGWRGKRMNRGH